MRIFFKLCSFNFISCYIFYVIYTHFCHSHLGGTEHYNSSSSKAETKSNIHYSYKLDSFTHLIGFIKREESEGVDEKKSEAETKPNDPYTISVTNRFPNHNDAHRQHARLSTCWSGRKAYKARKFSRTLISTLLLRGGGNYIIKSTVRGPPTP